MSTPPSRSKPTPAPKKSGGVASLVMKTAWLVAVAAGVWFVLNMQKTSQGPPIADAQAPPRASAATVAPENLQNVELTTAASIQRQQLSTAKFRQRQVIAAYDEVTRALKAWETELYAWEKTGPPLVKSEDGKRLARDQALVKRYRVVMNQEVPTREELTSTSGLADDLISPVREAFANPEDASIPSNDTTTNLRELRTRARKARDDLKNAREQIEVLLAEAGETPGDETLQAAIRRQVEQEASGRNALIAEAVRKAEEEGNRRVVEERANAARVALELEAERIRQEKELKEAEAKRVLEARRAEDARKAEDARMVLLRQKARSPEIKRLLAPLLAKGYTQPRSGGSFENIGELQPMSLQALRGTGCLDKDDHGMHTMLYINHAAHRQR